MATPTIVAMVQTIINESGNGQFWPIQQVFDAINEAQFEKESVANYPMVTTSMTFVPNGTILQWPTTTMMWPTYLEYLGDQYFIVSHAELERYDRNWRNTTPAQPSFFVLWDEMHLRPYPNPDQDYVFNIWGPGWGTEVSSATQDIFVTSTLLKMAVAFRAAATLFQYSRPDLAAQYFKQSDEFESQFRIQWRRQQGDNIKRLRPYNAVTHAQAGNIRIGKRLQGHPPNPYL